MKLWGLPCFCSAPIIIKRAVLIQLQLHLEGHSKEIRLIVYAALYQHAYQT